MQAFLSADFTSETELELHSHISILSQVQLEFLSAALMAVAIILFLYDDQTVFYTH